MHDLERQRRDPERGVRDPERQPRGLGMMRIKLALLRIDLILLRIEAAHGVRGLQPLPLDPAQAVLGPDLLQTGVSSHQIGRSLQHREPDSQHLELTLQHLELVHGVRDRERRVRDLNLQHLGPGLQHREGYLHQRAPDLLQKQGAMMRIGRLCIMPGSKTPALLHAYGYTRSRPGLAGDVHPKGARGEPKEPTRGQ